MKMCVVFNYLIELEFDADADTSDEDAYYMATQILDDMTDDEFNQKLDYVDYDIYREGDADF